MSTVRFQTGKQVGTVLAAASLVLAGMSATPAHAGTVNCDTSSNHESFLGGYHDPVGDNDLAGIRAPIKLRTNSDDCGTHPSGTGVGSWIGIQSGSWPSSPGSNLVQVGLYHYYDSALQQDSLCVFWENLPAAPVIDNGDCFLLNDDFYFFMIHNYTSGGNNYYRVEYCGPDDPSYAGCTIFDPNGVAQFSSGWAEIAVESQVSGCQLHIMGTTSDKESFGRDDSTPALMEVHEDMNSTSWTTPTFSRGHANNFEDDCSSGYYKDGNPNYDGSSSEQGVLKAWDTR